METTMNWPIRYKIAFFVSMIGWLYGLSVIIYEDLPIYNKLMLTALVVGSAVVWYMDHHDNG